MIHTKQECRIGDAAIPIAPMQPRRIRQARPECETTLDTFI